MCVAVDFISNMASELRGDDEGMYLSHNCVSFTKEKCPKVYILLHVRASQCGSAFDLVYMLPGNQPVLGILVTETLCLAYFQVH